MYNQEIVTKARNHYVRCRADEIVHDPIESMEAIIAAYKNNPERTAKAIYDLRNTGNVDDLLEAEDVIRKAAEAMADDEWFKTDPIKEAA